MGEVEKRRWAHSTFGANLCLRTCVFFVYMKKRLSFRFGYIEATHFP